jgi:hypothetical protein
VGKAQDDMKYEDLQGKLVVLEKRFEILLLLYERNMSVDSLSWQNPKSYTLLTKRVRTFNENRS